MKRYFPFCKYFLAALACILLFAGSAHGAEMTVTEAELTQLEATLTELRTRSESREQRLIELGNKLERSTADLKQARADLDKLNERLKTLSAMNRQTADSLTTANESLIAYEAEAKRTKDRLRHQRSMAYGLSCILLLCLVMK